MVDRTPTPQRGQPHPWLVPLYRRIGVMVVCVAWFAFELTQQDQLWLIMAGGATAYAAWDFFLSGNYRQPKPD